MFNPAIEVIEYLSRFLRGNGSLEQKIFEERCFREAVSALKGIF